MMEPWECRHDIWINGAHCSGCGISAEGFNRAMQYAARSNTTILTYIGDREFAVVVYAPQGEPHPSLADLEAIQEQVGLAIEARSQP